MNKLLCCTLGLVALGLAILGTIAADKPVPSVRWGAQYNSLTLPAGFDAITALLDFPPDSAVPLYSQPGPVMVLVIEGEITLSGNGTGKVYKAGQSFTPGGGIYEARNLGRVKAAVVATSLLPKGAQLDIFVGK